MTELKTMPKRIYAQEDSNQTKSWEKEVPGRDFIQFGSKYIRSDVVDKLAQALRRIVGTPGNKDHRDVAIAALSDYEGGKND